jgi:membrane protease YdiL (CAAX protease family)
MSRDQDGFAQALPGAPAPWGLLGTILWGTLGAFVWFAVQFAVLVTFITWRETAEPGSVNTAQLARDGFLLAFATIVAGPAWIAVSALASRWRGWRPRDYLALVVPRRGELLFGIACLGTLLIAFDLLSLALGRDVVPEFMRDAYVSSRNSNALVPFFIAVAVVAPITEEIVFSGFLFRGLSASFLGVSGTLIVTSLVWAGMHLQYDWFILGQIVVIGLVLGWLRWASGSTLLTIVLHMLTNLAACIQAAIKVEWLS